MTIGRVNNNLFITFLITTHNINLSVLPYIPFIVTLFFKLLIIIAITICWKKLKYLIKYIGILVDNKFKWNSHLKNLPISLQKFFYIFKNVIKKQKYYFDIYMKRIIMLYIALLYLEYNLF